MRYVIEMGSGEFRDGGLSRDFHRTNALACWEVIDTDHPQRRAKASRLLRADADDIADALNTKAATQMKVAA